MIRGARSILHDTFKRHTFLGGSPDVLKRNETENVYNLPSISRTRKNDIDGIGRVKSMLVTVFLPPTFMRVAQRGICQCTLW